MRGACEARRKKLPSEWSILYSLFFRGLHLLTIQVLNILLLINVFISFFENETVPNIHVSQDDDDGTLSRNKRCISVVLGKVPRNIFRSEYLIPRKGFYVWLIMLCNNTCCNLNTDYATIICPKFNMLGGNDNLRRHKMIQWMNYMRHYLPKGSLQTSFFL